MEEDQKIVRLFRELQLGISKHGIDVVTERMCEKLKQLDIERGDDPQKLVFDYILHITALQYKITKEDIIYSTERGAVVQARKMCFVLIMHHIGLSQYRVAKFFNRERQVVNRALKEFDVLGDQPEETQFIVNFKILDPQVLVFKSKYA